MEIDFCIYKFVHVKYFLLLIFFYFGERERERDDQPVDVFGISDVWELDVLPVSLVSFGDINARFKSNFLSKHVIYSSLAQSLPFLTSVIISREKIILHIFIYYIYLILIQKVISTSL